MNRTKLEGDPREIRAIYERMKELMRLSLVPPLGEGVSLLIAALNLFFWKNFILFFPIFFAAMLFGFASYLIRQEARRLCKRAKEIAGDE